MKKISVISRYKEGQNIYKENTNSTYNWDVNFTRKRKKLRVYESKVEKGNRNFNWILQSSEKKVSALRNKMVVTFM